MSLLIMFAGLHLAIKLRKRYDKAEMSPVGKKPIISLVAVTTVFRGGVMPIVDYFVLYHVLLPLVIGVHLPEPLIMGLVPVFVIYNLVVALYTVSIACLIAIKVGGYLKMESPMLHQRNGENPR